MSERLFVTTPTEWNRDERLNAVSWEAEFLFRRLALETNAEWRVLVSPENLEQSLRCRCFEPTRRFAAWSLPKIARHLSELLGAGIVRRIEHAGRCWLEVDERLRYHKGIDPTLGPPRPEQKELPMGGDLFAVPPPNPVRVENESEKSRKDESPRGRAGTRRAKARGDSPERFARDEEWSSDPLWGDVCRLLGTQEIVENGAMWEKRLREHKGALLRAYMETKDRLRDGDVANRGAFLTATFERIKAVAA